MFTPLSSVFGLVLQFSPLSSMRLCPVLGIQIDSLVRLFFPSWHALTSLLILKSLFSLKFALFFFLRDRASCSLDYSQILYVAEVGLECLVFLPSSPTSWDYSWLFMMYSYESSGKCIRSCVYNTLTIKKKSHSRNSSFVTVYPASPTS